jgi:hypothetical protein
MEGCGLSNLRLGCWPYQHPRKWTVPAAPAGAVFFCTICEMNDSLGTLSIWIQQAKGLNKSEVASTQL